MSGIRRRVLGPKTGHDRVEVLGRLLDRDAWAKAPDDTQEAGVARVAPRIGVGGEGGDEFRVSNRGDERSRQDADDRVAVAVQNERRSDD
jgi:hypothetical protein